APAFDVSLQCLEGLRVRLPSKDGAAASQAPRQETREIADIGAHIESRFPGFGKAPEQLRGDDVVQTLLGESHADRIGRVHFDRKLPGKLHRFAGLDRTQFVPDAPNQLHRTPKILRFRESADGKHARASKPFGTGRREKSIAAIHEKPASTSK